MKALKTSNPFRLLRGIRSLGRHGLSLQRRLYVFFLLFLVTVMSALLLIFFASGIFSAGLNESRIFLENELHHIAGDVEKDFGAVAVQGVSLSRRLTEQLERELQRGGLAPSELRSAPDSLEPLLDGCMDTLSAALEKNVVSAVFIVLDATVNPQLEYSESSRSGVFLKNMVPNAAYESPTSVRYMRGPAAIAKSRGMVLLPQWKMEFTVESGDFFDIAMTTTNDADISRLYYWNPKTILHGDFEKAMLLAVPMVASDGTVLGVCGFEVSDILFKTRHTPDNNSFPRLFAMLAPMHDNTPDASKAMLAGSYTVTSAKIDGNLTVQAEKNGFSSFTGPDGAEYSGVYQPVSLYPKDALHGTSPWILGIVMPRQDLLDYMSAQSGRVLMLLLTLFLLSVAAAVMLSRRYIRPVVEALESIRTQDASSLGKTRIPEIDDLIDYLAEADAKNAAVPEEDSGGDPEAFRLFDEFVKNIETLSPAERAVFNLYMEGYKAREITDILCLSINTIKTHNKRIYMKLKVSSREELLIYVNMMKEKGGARGGG